MSVSKHFVSLGFLIRHDRSALALEPVIHRQRLDPVHDRDFINKKPVLVRVDPMPPADFRKANHVILDFIPFSKGDPIPSVGIIRLPFHVVFATFLQNTCPVDLLDGEKWRALLCPAKGRERAAGTIQASALRVSVEVIPRPFFNGDGPDDFKNCMTPSKRRILMETAKLQIDTKETVALELLKMIFSREKTETKDKTYLLTLYRECLWAVSNPKNPTEKT